MLDGYISSEELQRQTGVFFNESDKKPKNTSETAKLKKNIDKYINAHNSTVKVRALAKSKERTNEYQMDLSADIVEILEKLKGELR